MPFYHNEFQLPVYLQDIVYNRHLLYHMDKYKLVDDSFRYKWPLGHSKIPCKLVRIADL